MPPPHLEIPGTATGMCICRRLFGSYLLVFIRKKPSTVFLNWNYVSSHYSCYLSFTIQHKRLNKSSINVRTLVQRVTRVLSFLCLCYLPFVKAGCYPMARTKALAYVLIPCIPFLHRPSSILKKDVLRPSSYYSITWTNTLTHIPISFNPLSSSPVCPFHQNTMQCHVVCLVMQDASLIEIILFTVNRCMSLTWLLRVFPKLKQPVVKVKLA